MINNKKKENTHRFVNTKLVSLCFCITFFITIFSILHGSAQGVNRTFLKFEIKEVDRPEKTKMGRQEAIYIENRRIGSLWGSIIAALDVDSLRVRIKGNCPDKFISYTRRGCQDSVYGIKNLVINTLAYNYNFIVSDIMDSTDVWVLKKKGNVKLPLYDFKLHDGMSGAGPNELGDFESEGMLIYYTARTIQHMAKVIVIDETDDSNLYDSIKIPYRSMQNKNELNAVLLNYGFEIVVEKRLEKFKLVQFND